ncbi:uncharacterized protein SRS1_14045 [Sporisorium reilianum f. sp. reilianum]|uniref:HD/PDEase domain-containing protein n=1 Tax=Sporisorium reilianum f. sp. reilianum TaxID=72559 RepID=A0A2N8UEI6_9BASI|nr:uncharacterized protein SRS1_14045 [Sporisorium reilianum f. sp. reilianum]
MDDLAPALAASSLSSHPAPPRLRASQRAQIISAAETFVKRAFAHHDPSHDWHHVHRVRLLALSLTRTPEFTPHTIDLLVVELGALFHDLVDAKYVAGSATLSSALAGFWAALPAPALVSDEQRAVVEKIVAHVSWTKDERRRANAHPSAADTALQAWLDSCAEFQCVSDADRLDSIGSIGVMRCAAYSATVNRPLYIPPANARMDPVPPAEQAEGYNGSAVGHFYEKLLRIRGERLYTEMAREEAERRQRAMRGFLEELDLEWLVACQGAELAMLAVEEEEEEEDDVDQK